MKVEILNGPTVGQVAEALCIQIQVILMLVTHQLVEDTFISSLQVVVIMDIGIILQVKDIVIY